MLLCARGRRDRPRRRSGRRNANPPPGKRAVAKPCTSTHCGRTFPVPHTHHILPSSLQVRLALLPQHAAGHARQERAGIPEGVKRRVRWRWGLLVLWGLCSRARSGGLVSREDRWGLPCPGQASQGSPSQAPPPCSGPQPVPVEVQTAVAELAVGPRSAPRRWRGARHTVGMAGPSPLGPITFKPDQGPAASHSSQALDDNSLNRIGVSECMQGLSPLQSERDACAVVPGVRRPMCRHLPRGAFGAMPPSSEWVQTNNRQRMPWYSLFLHAGYDAVFVAHGSRMLSKAGDACG